MGLPLHEKRDPEALSNRWVHVAVCLRAEGGMHKNMIDGEDSQDIEV